MSMALSHASPFSVTHNNFIIFIKKFWKTSVNFLRNEIDTIEIYEELPLKAMPKNVPSIDMTMK